MRVVFIGCVRFSLSALTSLSSVSGMTLAGIVTRRNSPENADFCSLAPFGKKQAIPVFYADENSVERMNAWLRDMKPDYIFCIGWSKILGAETLRIPRYGCIGYHPAKLPENRGRHPLIWAIALGLTKTESTFFYLDERADGGAVLDRARVFIGPRDDAGKLYEKITKTALGQLKKIAKKLARGAFDGIVQDESKAGSWRKRSPKDGQIDWRMSAQSIHNLIRALAKPYPGAECWHRGQWVKVWKSELAAYSNPYAEPGKILKQNRDKILVKCGERALWLLRHEIRPVPKKGSYL